MKVVQRPIANITPYEGNPRRNDAAVDAVANSIREFGFRQPIVVDENGVIVVGHTRWKAAQKLGMEKAPVHVAADLTPEQAKAYRIADNRSADIAEWDFDLLPIELTELKMLGVDLENLGFDDKELARLLNATPTEGLTDPDAVPAPPDAPTTQPGDLWVLGKHRLLCGDSALDADVDRLLDGADVHLVNSDPPYNVRVEPRSNNAIAAGNSSFTAPKKKASSSKSSRGHHQSFDLARHPEKSKGTSKKMRAKDRPLENDFVSDEEFEQLLDAWFGNIARVLTPGRCFYIWGGYANCGNYPPVLKRLGLYFAQAIIWVKEHPVLTRKDFMGNHEWCQPAETLIQTTEGPVPISSLRGGDRVLSYSRNHHAMVGLRKGLAVRPTARPYCGTMHCVRVGNKETWCTPGHQWSVKLVPEAASYWCVYLMRRGSWWRIGKSKLLSTWGFGVKHRLKTESGEEAWILSVHQSNVEATIVEQVVLAEYGIPTTTWSESAASRRTLADVSQLYERLDLNLMKENACRLLADHGRSLVHPFLRIDRTRQKIGRRTSLLVRSCNLLPEVMMVPVPGRGQLVTWVPISAVERSAFDGDVYSMDVERYGHYVADGLVTHNCFYGWREGAGHEFYGPANATDVWSVKKVNPQSMVHLTEKPVDLAGRALQYSSLPGENILDLFGGSGSTMIACEQLGRCGFLMEIDPPYCDVIVQRWEGFTGKKAERIGGGPTPEKTPASTGDGKKVKA